MLHIDTSSIYQNVLVNLDENKFGQVLTNLIGNALKFTPRGGRIAVHVAHIEALGSVRISVTDTGVGIAPVIVTAAQLIALSYRGLVGKYWQTVSRCRTILARYSSARGRSWLGTLQ